MRGADKYSSALLCKRKIRKSKDSENAEVSWQLFSKRVMAELPAEALRKNSLCVEGADENYEPKTGK